MYSYLLLLVYKPKESLGSYLPITMDIFSKLNMELMSLITLTLFNFHNYLKVSLLYQLLIGRFLVKTLLKLIVKLLIEQLAFHGNLITPSR